MTAKVTKVLDAWERGVAVMPSIWTDGAHIWSYGTCILATQQPWEHWPGASWVVNVTDYSGTTTGHVTAVKAYLDRAHNGRYREVRALKAGVGPHDLLNEACYDFDHGEPQRVADRP